MDTELNDLSKSKHLFVEFYTFNCRFCQMFLPEYNRIYDYFMETYGHDQVEMVKVDGYLVPSL
jgi:hypothetical protein